jgi:hypothetical protein
MCQSRRSLSIRPIIRVQGQQLDREYVQANADALGVRQVLARALDESKEAP